MVMTDTADWLLDALARAGVECLFGIPDPAFLGVMRKAQERGFALVAPHHEAAGGFMAEAAARLTGRPVAVMLSPGPGVANALPAMACARAERAPVLFLGGARGALRDAGLTGRFQHVDQMPLVAGAVKHAERVEAAADLPAALGRCLAAMMEGVPGPAYLDCPFPVMMARDVPVTAPAPPALRRAPQEAVVGAAAQLRQAQAPMMLVGHGLDQASRLAVADLARRLACPIVLTPGAACLPGLSHQCFPYAFSPVAAQIIAQADVVLAVGTALGEAVHFGRRRHWREGDETRRWIALAPQAASLEANRPIEVVLAGDLAVNARALSAAIPALVPQTYMAQWGEAERARLAAWSAQALGLPDAPLHPARLVAETMAACPAEALLVRDGGASVLFQLAQSARHEGGVLWSRAFAHLGTGLPYAIGALVAERARGDAPRPALVLSGDSAMLFHIGELEVAVRLRLPIVCVVAVDHQWGLEAAAYRQGYGPDAASPGAGWGQATRFDRIGQGFGATGLFVEKEGDLPGALAAAFAASGPVVIHAAIDPRANGSDLPGWAELASWYSDGMAPPA
ncbi:MAG: thiamine pyrophosphate-binding protein [Sphingomonadales bacterium]|nr:thiamine pyrophosphate-binding protein [Sphingomonadales bacterium]MDE2169618.1 thiamine pyrophosphate-binding protein [Sphingomonadales bacterium]